MAQYDPKDLFHLTGLWKVSSCFFSASPPSNRGQRKRSLRNATLRQGKRKRWGEKAASPTRALRFRHQVTPKHGSPKKHLASYPLKQHLARCPPGQTAWQHLMSGPFSPSTADCTVSSSSFTKTTWGSGTDGMVWRLINMFELPRCDPSYMEEALTHYTTPSTPQTTAKLNPCKSYHTNTPKPIKLPLLLDYFLSLPDSPVSCSDRVASTVGGGVGTRFSCHGLLSIYFIRICTLYILFTQHTHTHDMQMI